MLITLGIVILRGYMVKQVINFLIRQMQYLSTRVNMCDLMEEDDLKSRIFCNDRFNKMVEEWYKSFWAARNDPPILDKKALERQPQNIQPLNLLKNLEDPRLRKKAEEVRWRGKILPEIMVHNFIATSGSKDHVAKSDNMMKITVHLLITI